MGYKITQSLKDLNITGYIGWVKSLLDNEDWFFLILAVALSIVAGIAVIIWTLIFALIAIIHNDRKAGIPTLVRFNIVKDYIKEWWGRKPEHKV